MVVGIKLFNSIDNNRILISDPQALSDESDEESLSDGDNSSLFVGTADSSSRDASDISTEEVVTENEFDEFFN